MGQQQERRACEGGTRTSLCDADAAEVGECERETYPRGGWLVARPLGQQRAAHRHTAADGVTARCTRRSRVVSESDRDTPSFDPLLGCVVPFVGSCSQKGPDLRGRGRGWCAQLTSLRWLGTVPRLGFLLFRGAGTPGPAVGFVARDSAPSGSSDAVTCRDEPRGNGLEWGYGRGAIRPRRPGIDSWFRVWLSEPLRERWSG